MMRLSERIRRGGEEARTIGPMHLAGHLRSTLSFLEQWPIRVSHGSVSDGIDAVGPFAFIAHVSTARGDQTAAEIISANSCAAVIDAVPHLDLAELARCHRRISAAKLLQRDKPPVLHDRPISTSTLGAVFAQSTDLPFEVIVEELERLNASVGLNGWVDALLVCNAGLFHFGVQYPGDSRVMGGSVPPARERAANPPPIYFVPVIRPGADQALNRLAFLIAGQLAFFSPGYQGPPAKEVLGEGAHTPVLRRSAYSFALNGELRPVSNAEAFAHYLPRPVLEIFHGRKTLGIIDRQVWQDGCVIALRGKAPLEGILAFLPPATGVDLRVTRTASGLQLSQVLRLGHAEFIEMLNRFQARSNLRVKIVEPNYERRLLANEGVTSPFMARLFIGLLNLRDNAISEVGRIAEFDAIFDGLRRSISDVRDAADEFSIAWSSLKARIAQGEGVSFDGSTLRVEHLTDRELDRIFGRLTYAAVVVIKNHLQSLAKCLGVDVGFWFRKLNAFETGVAALAQSDQHLATYILDARREWSEGLVEQRNDVDHHGWRLPLVRYRRDGDRIEADAPLVRGEPVDSYVEGVMDRVCCAVEEVTTHLLGRLLPVGLVIHEVPVNCRDVNLPTRFEVTLATGGKQPWVINHHRRKFVDS